MLILGIDPGTRVTGYGLIQKQGASSLHVDHGCIIPKSTDPMADRLAFIFDKIDVLIRQRQVDVVALEKAFFAKNAAAALKLGQCRGVVMVAAARAGLPVFEYSPNGIKQAITGQGKAQKEQIQKMIRLLLSLAELPQSDAADALAVAMCHAQSYGIAQIANSP